MYSKSIKKKVKYTNSDNKYSKKQLKTRDSVESDNTFLQKSGSKKEKHAKRSMRNQINPYPMSNKSSNDVVNVFCKDLTKGPEVNSYSYNVSVPKD